jgi:hypothetical protein
LVLNGHGGNARPAAVWDQPAVAQVNLHFLSTLDANDARNCRAAAGRCHDLRPRWN